MNHLLHSCRLALALFVAAAASASHAAPQSTSVAMPTRLERVAAAGELRVCIWPQYYSVTYRNPKTRLLSGIDIDIANELARELGVTVRFVDSSFVQFIDKLNTDACDIAMHAIGISPERQTRVQFTRPYLRSDFYAITSKSSSIHTWSDLDQPGRVIAVLQGTVMEPVLRQRLQHATMLLVQPPRSHAQEVESGRADAFITDFPFSRRMLDLTDWARLIAPPQPFHPTDYAYALARGDRSLLERVDAFVAAIRKDGRLRRFAQAHRLEDIVLAD
ncbi:amino acid ABC transporter substrate-binding protein [Noviherbaspirillum sp. DKR-6]|uniref:Amino acid ABC transporter substrate-binding protein n=2 Tax=Noviherbaspirillum pedocola TaxID=2801341 RepID=A0A934W5T3_9BURK|nr:amino acid ABC transporter substrate-binding protein [Noviherbaspirillum pedocola]